MEEIFATFAVPTRSLPGGPGRSDEFLPKPAAASRRNHRHPAKPFRRQVSRACEACRAKRIKCDEQIPCRACVHRGVVCSVEGPHKARTLPQAEKELDDLRAKCKDLESELEAYKKRSSAGQVPFMTPDSSSCEGESPAIYGLLRAHHGHGQGLFAANPRTLKQSYYGKTSLFYFMRQLGRFITKTTGSPFTVSCFEGAYSWSAIRRECPPSQTQTDQPSLALCPQSGSLPLSPSMTRQQEEYFIGLFWESQHALTPIIDEADFRSHYDALWEGDGSQRKDSALVDIVIALCMQYGYTWLFGGSSRPEADSPASHDDPTIAGKWYYHRSRALLASELEGPSLVVVQASIFAIMYLNCASFSNMAHVMLAQAVRTAEIIGLHLEPPETMPQAQRELRKRVWWCLFKLESTICAKFGRNVSITLPEITASMPSDSREVALLTESSLGCYEDTNYLMFNYHGSMLSLVHRAIYDAIFRCSETVAQGDQTVAAEMRTLEKRAEFLANKIRALNEWRDELPDQMKTMRRGGGRAMSLDRQPLDIDQSAPSWLQRQRICLELNYHSAAYGLYRSFVTFSTPNSPAKPTADRHATACVNHAVAFTLIMHQVVTETDLMGGWHEYFLWQWNACLTIVGFIFAEPIHPATRHARRALDKAVEVFESFTAHFPFAVSAAAVARELKVKEEIIMAKLREGIVSGASGMGALPTPTEGSADGGAGDEGDVRGDDAGGADAMEDDLSWLDPNQQDDSLGVFVDWAMGVEAFGNFDRFNDQVHVGF